jgi:hypothetical protein
MKPKRLDHKQVRIIKINVKRGLVINLLFNFTYLETRTTFHIYIYIYIKQNLILKTNMPHICNFQCKEWYFFFIYKFLLYLD